MSFNPKKYFDAAASVPLDERVKKEIVETMDLWGNENSKHANGFLSRQSIDNSLSRIAKVLQCSVDQIFPTYSGTDSNRRLIWACQKRFGKENTYCSVIEHSSVSDEIDDKNNFDPSGNFSDIPAHAKFIALMQANAETGRIYDATELRKKFPNAIIARDAAQSFPRNIELDFANSDAITFSPQKFYGPKAIGLIWLKNPENFPEISKDSHTKNAFLIAGMARAFEVLADEVKENMVKIEKWQDMIESFIADKFKKDEYIIHEKGNPRVKGTINVAFRKVRGSELMTILSNDEEICVSTGSACSSDILSPTKTIKFIQRDFDFQFPIRISLHKFLDDEVVEEFCEILEHYARDLIGRGKF